MYSTQLSDYRAYDTDNMIFQPCEGRRLRVMTHNMDGTRGDLVFSTPRFLSFGLQPVRDGDVVVGYQMPLVMWGKKGPTPDEESFVRAMEDITGASREHILHHRAELGIEEDGLDRLSPLYYKTKTDQKDHAPILYVRVNTCRDDEEVRIRTLFIEDTTREPIDPMTLLNKRCLVDAAVRIDGVRMGAKARFQMRLLEARVRLLDRNGGGFKSLLEPGRVFAVKK